MAQLLRGLSVLVVDLTSELSVHIVGTYNSLYLQFQGIWCPLLAPMGTCTNVVHINT